MPNKKILFACIPADGHFNPMTQLAFYLKEKGYDVRWYTGKDYSTKLNQMGIPYLPFQQAKEINIKELDEAYPERKKLKGIAHIKFDIINLFINRMKDYYIDVEKIYKSFTFDILVCDNTFPGPIIKDKLEVPVASIGVVPLALSAPDIPQYGLGHQPATTFIGKRKQNFIKLMADKMVFSETKDAYNQLLQSLGLPPEDYNIFDASPLKSSIFLQNGIPEIDFPRNYMPDSVKYIGALEVWSKKQLSENDKDWKNILDISKKTILISQGTIEKNNNKLTIPALEAFKDSDYNILVATAHNGTKDLKKRYPQDNIFIENYINYDTIMPLTNLFITNGGYGSSLISLKYGVPMITAGINEGKNEICARLDHSGVSIDLKTERPRVTSLKNATDKIFNSNTFLKKAKEVSKQLRLYNTLELCERHIIELL
ncbi:hypothetical protein [Aquimarina sp. MMG016]|uniref:glycosyltransferase n=1 Tax=Aquimarina sp. MMG016 TaxID=2822690 RepID=UPI001B3A394E|nr:hypothetical protein [Aquimarina sp. MMG016]MBQ4820229.1 hypothetical protein [Aquimarina sp. MMG016]